MSLLVSVVVVLLIAGVLVWAVRALGPTLNLPAVAIQVAVVVIVVAAVIVLARMLLGYGGVTVDLPD